MICSIAQNQKAWRTKGDGPFVTEAHTETFKKTLPNVHILTNLSIENQEDNQIGEFDKFYMKNHKRNDPWSLVNCYGFKYMLAGSCDKGRQLLLR